MVVSRDVRSGSGWGSMGCHPSPRRLPARYEGGEREDHGEHNDGDGRRPPSVEPAVHQEQQRDRDAMQHVREQPQYGADEGTHRVPCRGQPSAAVGSILGTRGGCGNGRTHDLRVVERKIWFVAFLRLAMLVSWPRATRPDGPDFPIRVATKSSRAPFGSSSVSTVTGRPDTTDGGSMKIRSRERPGMSHRGAR